MKEGREVNNMIPTREKAYELLTKYNKSESLIKHGLAVEAVMSHFAQLFDKNDVLKWSIIGLLHDVDYEMYPEQHCIKAREILEENNYPEEYIHAVESHGWGICSKAEPIEKMEKVLYTIDELTGLITATVFMRPSKSILDLEVKSVKKKFKTKGFAAGVDRNLIIGGAEMLQMELDIIIDETIKGMQSVAKELGLEGQI